MSEILERAADGVTVGDAVEFCRRHFIVLITFILLGLAIGLGTSFVLRKQWEATSNIQIGQIYSGNGPPTQIEATARSLERMRQAPFVDAVLTRLGLPLEAGVNRESDVLRASLNVNYNRGADILQIAVRGESPDEARRNLAAVQEQLIDIHSSLAKPSIDRMKKEMVDVQEALGIEQARKKRLDELVATSLKSSAARFSVGVLITEMVQQNDLQLRTLSQRKIALEEQIDPDRTFNTRPLGAIAVSRHPAFPRKLYFLLGGAVLGMAFAVAAGLYADSRRR